MMMVDPQLIFLEPDKYVDYLTSSNPEGQFFERKEVVSGGAGMKDAREKIIKTVSAFTNASGGLLVLGIKNNGTINGLNHLSESEHISLGKIIWENLRNHQSQSKEWSKDGRRILLIFSPEGISGVCATVEGQPRAWRREGASSLPLSMEQIEQLTLQRNKKFEQLTVTEYDPSLLNEKVYSIFKSKYLNELGSNFDWSDDKDLMLHLGILKKIGEKLFFTNAGYLFLAKNPSGLIPSATIRFLKYDIPSAEKASDYNPSFDRTFDGCLPILLQKIRLFVNDSAFFKKYSYRNPYSSGIIEEPELPPNATEEAIVNAIVHRDYSINLPIECILYKDAFVVKSPGKLQQPSFVPAKFSLESQRLDHYPRNPKIMEWARNMVDENNQKFVKALSEGNRTMRMQMKEAHLPSPEFETNGFTKVTLYNNSVEREARINKLTQPLTGEYTNLFEIQIAIKQVSEPEVPEKSLQTILLGLIKDKLNALGWFLDREGKSRITAHQKARNISQGEGIDKVVKFFAAYSIQIHKFKNKNYLSIDFSLQVKNSLTLDQLTRYNFLDFSERKTLAKFEKNLWAHGIIKTSDEIYSEIYFYDYDTTLKVLNKEVLPNLSKVEIKKILYYVDKRFNIDTKIKELSLAKSVNASRERWAKIEVISHYFAQEVFPITYNDFTASLNSKPVSLLSNYNDENAVFSVHHNLKEPDVKFADNSTAPNIASGLTKFGSFSNDRREIEIVPFAMEGFEHKMQDLLKVVVNGSNQFKGIERTFKVKAQYRSIITRSDANFFLEESERLLEANPSWVESQYLDKIFMIHVPEDIYPVTDINSPYYSIKEFLLSKGMPVQMLDTPTLNNVQYKDLNLALNIVAKTGGTPWILPNALIDADCFIGLSYAQYWDDKKLRRTMGYANVFTSYGEWQFYKGNSSSFDFSEKHIHLANLVTETIKHRTDLPQTASIHIHYTNKFSNEDIAYISAAVFKIKPKATVTFVWINTHHNLRMFDSRIEGNGSLSRGSYVVTGNNQFYLSTTGYSLLRKTLGMPVMLEVNFKSLPNGASLPMHKTIAQHLLALSKLNWAGTQSVNAEPVTTKYAHDIAVLSEVFYRKSGSFKLHARLEKTPWFI